MKFANKNIDPGSRFKSTEFDSDFEKCRHIPKGKKKTFDLGFERSHKE